MRVRRTRSPVEDESKPVEKARIRRVRQPQEATVRVSRVRRVRSSSAPAQTVDEWDWRRPKLTRFQIDWDWGWGQKFQLYLITSFLYYHMSRSFIKDTDYDQLCVEILKGFDRNDHPHKHLITKDDLRATTGFAIKEYPRIVVGAAYHMIERHIEV